MKTSVDYMEGPVEFNDTSGQAAVTLEVPSETPGYEIIPAKQPLKVKHGVVTLYGDESSLNSQICVVLDILVIAQLQSACSNCWNNS